MKITFITPPSLDYEKPAERTAGCTRVVYNMPNIYELTVAAILEKEGHEVRYRNFVLEDLSIDDSLDVVKVDDSDIYIFWTVNLSLFTDYSTAEYFRSWHRESSYCIFLGPGATYNFKYFLKRYTDFIIVRGEPEDTLKELMRLISAGEDWTGCKGITYLDKKTEKIVHTPTRPLITNLDELPFPAIHLIKDYTFYNPKLKVTPYMAMVTSRNCPFHCIYCVPSSLTFAREIEYKNNNDGKKPPIGFRSVENVIAEIDWLAGQGFKAIGFLDDNFIVNKKRLKAIGEALLKHQIVWGCQARVDAIDEEVASMLSQYNCKYVDLGVESFDAEILKYIKKGVTPEQNREAILLLKKHNVPVKLNILIGTSPLETKKTIKKTYKEAKKLKVDQIMFNIVSPFPGTEFYEMARENGWIRGGMYIPTDVQRNSILNYPELTHKQMEKLLFRNNLKFFLSPGFIRRNLFAFSSFDEFKANLKALKIKLFG